MKHVIRIACLLTAASTAIYAATSHAALAVDSAIASPIESAATPAKSWAQPNPSSRVEARVAALMHEFRKRHVPTNLDAIFASTDDLKIWAYDWEAIRTELFGGATKATPRRVRALTKSYRNFMLAVRSGNVADTIAAATVFHNNVATRSSMFTKAWNHMVRDPATPRVVFAAVKLAGQIVEAKKQGD